ncbi:MAG: hypothetical protein UY96_C0010G0041 [Parcubacteria group bacterium GW2011_GWB1_56_8]|nr:MAG: hypothetical protein UY96_C0010G0041 [Parcubacteria group bacterium GW2011_GWB1_56_8]
MPIDFAAWNRAKAQRPQETGGFKKGDGDLWKIPSGTTVVVICPPTLAMGGIPLIQTASHYDLGADNKAAMCLGPENLGLWADATQSYLQQRSEPLVLSANCDCPVCRYLEALSPEETAMISPKKLKSMRCSLRFFLSVIPWATYSPEGVVPLPEAERKPRPLSVNANLGHQIEDLFANTGGVDPTDPARAWLVRFVSSKARRGTYEWVDYRAEWDVSSIQAPLALPKPQRYALAEAQKVGGVCDLHRLIAAFVRGPDEIHAWLTGVEAAATSTIATDAQPACYGRGHEKEDATCIACPFQAPCAKICRAPIPAPTPAKPVSAPTPRLASRPVPTPPRSVVGPSPAAPVASRLAPARVAPPSRPVPPPEEPIPAKPPLDDFNVPPSDAELDALGAFEAEVDQAVSVARAKR